MMDQILQSVLAAVIITKENGWAIKAKIITTIILNDTLISINEHMLFPNLKTKAFTEQQHQNMTDDTEIKI